MIPATDIAISVLNWDVTHTFNPRVLPKMNAEVETADRSAYDDRRADDVDERGGRGRMVEKLEIHYLANRDSQFYFALLTDFADAPTAEVPNDGALLAAALEGIERLNARYAAGPPKRAAAANTFLPVSSPSPVERVGKQMDGLGTQARKAGRVQSPVAGRARHQLRRSPTLTTALLASIRYVITLDSDTQLPRDVARKLVATIRHPLNRAQFDPQTRRVVRGYGILQPRVSISLESSARSRFARIFSGNTGIDPYTTAVSDVYQDLFAEGSFTGKGSV